LSSALSDRSLSISARPRAIVVGNTRAAANGAPLRRSAAAAGGDDETRSSVATRASSRSSCTSMRTSYAQHVSTCARTSSSIPSSSRETGVSSASVLASFDRFAIQTNL
jgi:hypothetical protein